MIKSSYRPQAFIFGNGNVHITIGKCEGLPAIGITHGHTPHKVGDIIEKNDIDYGLDQKGTVLIFPTSGHRNFVVFALFKGDEAAQEKWLKLSEGFKDEVSVVTPE